jgi:hypothetical protein
MKPLMVLSRSKNHLVHRNATWALGLIYLLYICICIIYIYIVHGNATWTLATCLTVSEPKQGILEYETFSY